MKTAENIKHVRLNVRVTGELAAYVEKQISPEGLYEGQSDLVRDALRQHRENQNKEELRRSILASYEQLGNGDFREISNKEIFDEAMQELRNEGHNIPHE